MRPTAPPTVAAVHEHENSAHQKNKSLPVERARIEEGRRRRRRRRRRQTRATRPHRQNANKIRLITNPLDYVASGVCRAETVLHPAICRRCRRCRRTSALDLRGACTPPTDRPTDRRTDRPTRLWPLPSGPGGAVDFGTHIMPAVDCRNIHFCDCAVPYRRVGANTGTIAF